MDDTMSKDEFLKRFAEVLMSDDAPLAAETALGEFAGWDSMGQMAALSLLDELGVKVPPGRIAECQTVADVLAIAGDKVQ
jgi:acyl carrier protein